MREIEHQFVDVERVGDDRGVCFTIIGGALDVLVAVHARTVRRHPDSSFAAGTPVAVHNWPVSCDKLHFRLCPLAP